MNISIIASLNGNIFDFSVSNNYNLQEDALPKGIGLINVKRRLDVLYPEHELRINEDGSFFNVTLSLPLKNAV